MSCPLTPCVAAKDWIPAELVGRSKSSFSREERRTYNRAKRDHLGRDEYEKQKEERQLRKAGKAAQPADEEMPLESEQSWVPEDLRQKPRAEFTRAERKRYNHAKKKFLGAEEYERQKALYFSTRATETNLTETASENQTERTEAESPKDEDATGNAMSLKSERTSEEPWVPASLRGKAKSSFTREELKLYNHARKQALGEVEYYRRKRKSLGNRDTIKSDVTSRKEQDGSQKPAELELAWIPQYLIGKDKASYSRDDYREYFRAKRAYSAQAEDSGTRSWIPAELRGKDKSQYSTAEKRLYNSAKKAHLVESARVASFRAF